MNVPKRVVLSDVKPLIDTLEDYLMDLQTGHHDFQGIMSHIVESVQHRGEAAAELLHLHESMARYDLIPSGNVYVADWEYSDNGGNIFVPELITSCATRIGHRLVQQFQELKLYENGVLNFEYEGVTRDKSILLRYRPRYG